MVANTLPSQCLQLKAQPLPVIETVGKTFDEEQTELFL
jgi:hypothetical protein